MLRFYYKLATYTLFLYNIMTPIWGGDYPVTTRNTYYRNRRIKLVPANSHQQGGTRYVVFWMDKKAGAYRYPVLDDAIGFNGHYPPGSGSSN